MRAVVSPGSEPDAVAQPRRGSYAQILQSSAVIGASSFLNILIGILRTKAMAVMLGPAGFGLMGALTSISDLIRSLVQVGINGSGVRQIAAAAGTGDGLRIGRTAVVLCRTALVLAAVGAVALLLCARPISQLTFGDDQHAVSVALLSMAVFFRVVSDAQSALIQGMRRIGDLARLGLIGSIFGTLASIPLVYWLREEGVAWSLVVFAAITALASWSYANKISLERTTISRSEFGLELSELLRLGLAFMASGFLMMGAAYAVRIILIDQGGLQAAGLYQSAWTVGGMYVGLVLQAMSADFYPRLVASVHDPVEGNRLVNEQAHVSLLLAGPGVIATLVFAPLVVSLLYSVEFGSAVETLQWICLGMALRVVTWPMGFLIVAKNRQLVFFATELAWTTVNVALSWILVARYGLVGAGVGFFLSYVFHGFMIYPIVRASSGFRWSSRNRAVMSMFAASLAVAFCGLRFLRPVEGVVLGSLVLVATSVYALREVSLLAWEGSVPRPFRRLLRPFAGRTTPKEGA